MAICYPNRSAIASLFDSPDFAALLEFPLDLFVLVAVALGALWGMLRWKPWSRRTPVATAPEPAPLAVAPTTVPSAAGPAAAAAIAPPARTAVPPHILAVIAAAVHSCVRGRPHRVASVVEVKEALDWAREGRRHIFASHKLR